MKALLLSNQQTRQLKKRIRPLRKLIGILRMILGSLKGYGVYAMPLAIPKGNISVSLLPSITPNLQIVTSELPGTKETIKWTQQTEGLVIQSPGTFSSDYAPSFKITFKKIDDESRIR